MAEAKAFKMIPHCTKGTITYEMDELVRCKECRFRDLHQCNCEKKENVTYGMFTEDDFFCANGEPRTEV